MTAGSVARRYAKAFHDLATEDGNVDEAAAALAILAEAVKSLDAGALAPGALDAGARYKLGAALASPFGTSTTLGKFVRLLAERDRLSDLPMVHEWYVRINDRAAGRVRLTVKAATPPDQSQIDAVVSAFRSVASGNIVAQIETDASILGGAIVEVEGRVYDGSVKTKLARLAARMAGEA